MPYRPEHKAETRARIVEAARVLFNRDGFSDVRIADIMGAAGLTHGGFYHHFASKDELYVEVVRAFVRQFPSRRWDGAKIDMNAVAGDCARQVVQGYL